MSSVLWILLTAGFLVTIVSGGIFVLRWIRPFAQDGSFRWKLWRLVLLVPLLAVLAGYGFPGIELIDSVWVGPPQAVESSPQAGHATMVEIDQVPIMKEPGPFHYVDWAGILIVLWALGAGIAVCSLVGGMVRLRELRRSGSLLGSSDPIVCALQREAAALGMAGSVIALESKQVEGALVIGFFKPVLVLGPRCFDGLSNVEQALVLRHECQHIRNYDNVQSLGLLLVASVLWFSPLQWFARKYWEADREEACDQRVLDSSPQTDPRDYAGLLLTLSTSTHFFKSGSWDLASSMAGTYELIQRRISMIFQPKAPRWAQWGALAALAIVFLVAAQAMPPIPAQQDQPEEQSGSFAVSESVAPELLPFTWPLAPGEGKATMEYGPNIHPISGAEYVHRGIDVAVPQGRPVHASLGGTVAQASYDADMGNQIIVDHGNGYKTVYAKLKDMAVKVGQAVLAGEILGHSGNTGVSTGPHLHFEVWKDGVSLDPRTVLPPGPTMAQTE